MPGTDMLNHHIKNRRSHRRVIVSNSTTISHQEDSYEAKILNISAGGAGICLEVRLANQSLVSVNVENFGIFPARIIRQMQNGVAVKFEMSEQKENKFIELVTSIILQKRQEKLSA
jgi:PilZ domain